MTNGHDPLRTSLGAYLLGALEPADRAEVETHLARCQPYRDELAALAGLPGLLGLVPAAEAAATSATAGGDDRPDPRVLDRALTELGRRRRSSHRRRLAGVAAAVLISAAAGAGVTAVVAAGERGSPAPAPAGRVIAATDAGTGVHATATLLGRPAGTAITLRLTGVPPGLHCQLVAVAVDGRREVAGSWRATYDGQADVTGITALSDAELTTLRVVSTDGTRLVTLAVPR